MTYKGYEITTAFGLLFVQFDTTGIERPTEFTSLDLAMKAIDEAMSTEACGN
jgi:hypothetical protein